MADCGSASKQPLESPTDSALGIRRSSREIKRRKFDDELIDSDLIPKTKKLKDRLPQKKIVPDVAGKQVPSKKPKKPSRNVATDKMISDAIREQAAKSIGRWLPADDLALITGVLQVIYQKAWFEVAGGILAEPSPGFLQ